MFCVLYGSAENSFNVIDDGFEVTVALHVRGRDLLVDDGEVTCKHRQYTLEVVTHSPGTVNGRMRERERERERQTDRHRERERERQTERQRQSEREGEKRVERGYVQTSQAHSEGCRSQS